MVENIDFKSELVKENKDADGNDGNESDSELYKTAIDDRDTAMIFDGE